MVETGVNYGISSAFILQALEDNGEGRLYSIDLPRAEYRTPGCNSHSDWRISQSLPPGFVIPVEIRDRWRLSLGDSKIQLPRLLDRIDAIDFFYHDSKHTYEHMMFEYETILPHLKDSGIVGSDDITWNGAFDEFCLRHQLVTYKRFRQGFAVHSQADPQATLGQSRLG